MAGVHVIKGAIEVRNVRNILLVALERNANLPQIISECGSSGDTSNVECFGIRFKDVRDITISSLILWILYATTRLTFIDSTGIVIQTLCVSTTEQETKSLIFFLNTTDIVINSLNIAQGDIHVAQSKRVDISNVSFENGSINFTQTIDIHISDMIATCTCICAPFDPFSVKTAYTTSTTCISDTNTTYNSSSTCIGDGLVLKSRDVIILLNTLNTTIARVTIHYTGKDGISLLNTLDTTIKNVTIYYTGKAGISLTNTSNTTITIVTIHYTMDAGIRLLNTSNMAITNITICYIERSGAGIEIIGSSGSTLLNVHVINSDVYGIIMMHKRLNDIGIYMDQSQGIEINGSVILKCFTAIQVTAVNDSNITACTIKQATHGISIYDYMGANHQISVKNTQVLHTKHYALLVQSMIHGKIIDVELINSKAALHLYSVIDTVIKSVTIINWNDEAVLASEVKNTSLVHLLLTTTNLTTHTVNRFYGIILYNCSNVTIGQSIFTNIPSFDEASDLASQPAVVALYYSEKNIVIRDCSFEANNITALIVLQSKVTISGKVNFTGNTAYRGAAMTFMQGGKMILVKDSNITFNNNSASTTGGAIYLTTTYSKYSTFLTGRNSFISTECFLEMKVYYKPYQLTFLNNEAGMGGNDLYGGGLQDACNHFCKSSQVKARKKSETCLHEFLTVSNIKNTTLSYISSDPLRVCLCVGGIPDCINIFKTVPTNGLGPYPGQTIEISAVVVGQNFGTVSGAVYAQLINSPFNNNTSTLNQGQETQGVNHNSCNSLQYTIYSPVENITIMLTSVKLKETYMVTQQTFTETRKAYEEYNNSQYRYKPFPQAILEFPVYINIPLEPCPPGFSITHKHPVTCDCVRQLRELPGVTCDIEDVTIYRSGQVWVGQLKSNFNETDYGQINVASAKYCPFNYCKNGGLKIHLSHSHDQCNYNHSGIVCGECMHDLSLVLGSDQCLNCSNTYLLLLLPFAVAGVVLVAFIKLLDITVSSGFINSLIFYSNIVKVNEYIFLRHRTTNPITLFMSWFNLDLGIETCFYDGLDAYAKAWLQFVFPFYLWCIAGFIIIVARYSSRFARLTGNNSVPVLATLFLLSYAKLLRNVITILSYTTVDTTQGQKVVWSADGNIDYLGPQHVPLFTTAIATLILLWLPYTTLFLCGQWVCTINLSFITQMSMKLKPFLDAHYAPMTDKHRYWFGILLGVRIVILLISVAVPASNFSISAFSVCIAAGALVSYMAIGPPLYRNKHVAVFEITLFINLALLGLTKFYVVSTDGNQTAATLTLLTVAFVQFLGLVLYRGYSALKPVFTQYYQQLHNKEEEEDVVDGEQREGVWRYDTSMREWEKPQNLTPYTDATAL